MKKKVSYRTCMSATIKNTPYMGDFFEAIGDMIDQNPNINYRILIQKPIKRRASK